jgi:hypothetical protein
MTLIVFCASCVTTKLPPISSAGAEFQPLKDEIKLWERSRDEETKLRDNVDLYQDPLLEDYLEQIVGRLNPPGMADNPELAYTVTVLENPTLNAFAFPHGPLYVHTGLLARMESEDQLATVLGHEMTHVENRHMLRHRRSARNKQIGFGVGAVAAAVILAGEAGEAYDDGKYGKAATAGTSSTRPTRAASPSWPSPATTSARPPRSTARCSTTRATRARWRSSSSAVTRSYRRGSRMRTSGSKRTPKRSPHPASRVPIPTPSSVASDP